MRILILAGAALGLAACTTANPTVVGYVSEPVVYRTATVAYAPAPVVRAAPPIAYVARPTSVAPTVAVESEAVVATDDADVYDLPSGSCSELVVC
jgi:hypothetical protein